MPFEKKTKPEDSQSDIPLDTQIQIEFNKFELRLKKLGYFIQIPKLRFELSNLKEKILNFLKEQ